MLSQQEPPWLRRLRSLWSDALPAAARHGWQPTFFWNRWIVLAGGYATVALFFGALAVIRALSTDVPWPSALLLAAVFASPLPLVLLWDRITSVKLFSFEVNLRDFTVPLDHDLAVKMQEQKSSQSMAMIEGISASINKYRGGDPVLFEVNLEDGRYWWPTRFYLLAAVIDDYANIPSFVFVEGGNERRFIGMATPRSTRLAIARSFSNDKYEEKYSASQGHIKMPTDQPISQKINDIIMAWQWQFGGGADDEERNFDGNKVDKSILANCLHGELDESYLSWDGCMSRLLQYHVLTRGTDYMPLVQDGRLKEIAGRHRLAMSIAEGALRRQIG